jgi:hypothetical protein
MHETIAASIPQLPFAGLMPAVVTEVDDATLFTRHWTDTALFAAIGLAFLTFGILLFAGKIKGGKGKPRVAGAFLALLGALFGLGGILVIPFERVSVGPAELKIAGGLLGAGENHSVNLDDVRTLELIKERRSRSGGGGGRRGRRSSRGTRIVNVATFTLKSGGVDKITMSGVLRGAALPLVIDRVEELGGNVVDRRSEFVE